MTLSRILHIRRTSIGGILILLAVMLVSAAVCVGAQHTTLRSDTFSMPDDYGLGSVAWSPKGDSIAFIAARWKDDNDRGLDRNSIWVLSLSDGDKQTKLRRLVTLTRKANGEGIAAVLFWLDNDRIGWATRDGLSYTFMQMGLRDKKPKRLVNQGFRGVPCSDCDVGSAPGDVYYDADCRTLLFSGTLAPAGVYVRILPLSSKKVRNLSVPRSKRFVYPKGYIDFVTLCGSLRNPQKPVFYISASMVADSGGGSYLWTSNSYSLRQDKVISTSGPIWPRTSPDGKSLACYLQGRLALYDLKSGKHKVLAKRTADSPAGGWCPFSWSPDGKMIAYSDGPRIKIVSVTSEPTSGLESGSTDSPKHKAPSLKP